MRNCSNDMSDPLRNDVERLAQELQAPQIQIELQNEELRQNQARLQEARDRYVELYDFAPGHVMVQPQNIIAEANLTACELLGVEREALLGARLTGWINRESRNGFYLHRKSVLKSGKKQTCELVMNRFDGTNFDAMLESVPVRGKPGWLSVAITDISRRKKVEEELKVHREKLEDLVGKRTHQLRELARKLVEVQEQERSNISRELHDEVGQLLTYAGLLIDKASRKPEEQTLTEARSVIRDAVSRLRNLSESLSPPLLVSGGLLESLESLFGEYTKHTQIKVNFNYVALEGISANLALVIYRIVQEALTNVARHARATKVNVLISRNRGGLRVRVRDNGIGFDPKAVKRSTGLTGMRERALALDGEISVDSGVGKGTKIIAALPLS